MQEHSTLVAGLCPLPLDCVRGDPRPAHNTAPTAVQECHDPVVATHAHDLLADLSVGTLQIHIADEQAAAELNLHVDESYELELAQQSARICARSRWGALHGLTTLWQLAQNKQDMQWCWQIADQPRMPWRGVLIDVARHFIPLPTLERVIKGMSHLKMNVLHLHLSDDQGFRFASKSFPQLASEDHYTQEELIELVGFAHRHGVRVVPELDVPGHVTSWLVAYPQWGARQVSPAERFGVHKACLDPTNEAVYTALGELFAELAGVFVDEYVHIGGDEVNPSWWRDDAEAQAFIQKHDLVDERGLQAYFNRRVVEIVQSHGKRVVAWDEVLHEQMPELVVQNWRGATTRDRALARGLDCVVSAGFYLDLFMPADLHLCYDPQAQQYALTQAEDSWRQDLRLEHVAAGIAWTDMWREEAIEFVPPQADTDTGEEINGPRVLGGEACLWSELVDADTLPVRLFSRLPAVAECLWGRATIDLSSVEIDYFYSRLSFIHRLPELDVVAWQQQALTRLGLTADQQSIAAMLEPVKWYARLLGQQALQARLMGREMPQARPYDVHTPLNRVVDMIAPESLAARGVRQLSDASLLAHAQTWQQLRVQDWPEDMQAVITAFAELGEKLVGVFTASTESDTPALSKDLQALYVPHGEYMLAVIPGLLARWSDV